MPTVTLRAASDPVAAYDEVASLFALLTAERRDYLDAIDRLVISHAPATARSLLDVGAGDGRRSRLIASAVGCSEVVLVEPSAGMRQTSVSSEGYVALRIEDLSELRGEFDVVLCLWNVIGHVFPHASRIAAMKQFHRLLSPGGRLLLDVTHRYNAARYGVIRTAGRFVYDRLRPSERNGDVTARWLLDGREFSVRGHVFTSAEVAALANSAGLIVEKRFVVDYETGVERGISGQGNLLYVMKRA